ncbi:hypothetical protein CAEBREN_28314 [Caenorhabditis brenneri]|uniref:Uncharacterized protein n=1 Tax=Caenorhabditis brenneri TaxID=135651 RepID=G0P3S8_CAEBE|nr:hypothetical protein CAEBREN_28314 [Caenorhabditis brenneri]
MSKRQNNTALEINAEAKRMAIAQETNRLLIDASRQRRNEARPPPKCALCRLEHLTVDCTTFIQEEKMAIARERRLCLICLKSNRHHPMNCRTLRNFEELCKNRVCATAYTVHHKSICDKNAYPAAAPNAQQDNQDQDEDE